MKKAIFKTKFAEDYDRNGQEVTILDYVGNNMYSIQFNDGKRLTVYDTELIF